MTTSTAEATTEFRTIPIKEILESKTNPRRHFDEKAMKDIVASVKEKGILVPILVREIPPESAAGVRIPGYFEIVAGARRYRAAKAAGLKEVPALVRDLTDEQALEAQVIENLQRADVHPLDEAEGYAALMAKTSQDVAAIALKVGKSESYVYQRLKLTELIEPAKKAFWGEKITAGHAVLIARLQPDDQKEALKETLSPWDGGVVSVRELSSYIQRDILTDLSKAPWKKDDATLVPKAGACSNCPKRSGACAALFEDISKGDRCLDKDCYKSKSDAFFEQMKAKHADCGLPVVLINEEYNAPQGVLGRSHWHELKNKKKCDKLARGIFHDGPRRGKAIDVCSGMRCPIHSGFTNHNTPEQVEKSKAEDKKWDRRSELDKELFAVAIKKAPASMSRQVLERLAEVLADSYGSTVETIDELFDSRPVKKLSDRELSQFITAHALAGGYDGELDGIEPYAKKWGVDVAAVKATLKAKWNEEDKREKERLAEKEAKGAKLAAAAKKAKS